ncbi:MAG: 16S rRNA (cytosine(1402)-N(4))-methyltransferase RsmH [Acetobacteraceae bacterium]|nr:16S rRNA (cytosine(1402)-N(4))-methyltransferase RsmH [Acetobacteraceae bacterium]
MAPGHVPVLLLEVLEALRPRPGGFYLDGTVGEGGHALALARAAPGGTVLGIDRDAGALETARRRLEGAGCRVVLVHGDYADMGRILRERGLGPPDGVLLDLGVSSHQFDDPERGFSFQRDGPLDMRYDRTRGPTAADLVNRLPAEELRDLIWRYGEERWAGRIARFLVRARRFGPIATTSRLAEVVGQAIPAAARRRGPHPARRTFQALRIATNRELESLEAGLDAALDVLRPGGRVAVISFHSLEDRLVKRAFLRAAGGCRCPPGLPVCACGARARLRVLTPRPIRPSAREVEENPRARSAKLRAAERLESMAGSSPG